MHERYLRTITELINVILKLNGKDEVDRIAVSDERLAKDRFIRRAAAKFGKGEVYQFEFGRNYFTND